MRNRGGKRKRTASVGFSRGRGGSAAATEGQSAELIEYLSAGGPALPDSLRAAELRAALVSRAQEIPTDRGSYDAVLPVKVLPGAFAPFMARAAAAVLAAFVVLAGLGAVSADAMPGDAMYPVKRLFEGTHLLMLPAGQAEADALLEYADARMDELEAADARGMETWYGPLASGAQGRIDRAYQDAAGLASGARKKTRQRARRAEERLQAIIGRTLPNSSGESEEELQKVLERARRRLGTPGSEPGGSSGDGGGQQSPGGPGGQQGTQQQQLQQGQTDPGSDTPQQQHQQQQGPGQGGSILDATPLEQILFSPQKGEQGKSSFGGAPDPAYVKGLQAPTNDSGY